MTDTLPSGDSTRPTVLVLGALALLTFGVWAKSLGGGFVWDDVWLFPGRPDFWQLSNLGTMLTQMDNVFTDNPNGFYRPLVTVTFLADALIWGISPAGFHLSNLLWHVGTVWLVFAMGRCVGLSTVAAMTAAAVFAVHPVTVESVAWINGRNNILAGFFYLAAITMYLQWRSRGVRTWLYGAMVALTLSLFAKEYAVTFPVMVAVTEWVFPGRTRDGWERWWDGIRRSLLFVPAMAVYFLLRWAVLPAGVAGVAVGAEGIGERLILVPTYLLAYARLIIWPNLLTVFQPPPGASPLVAWAIVIAVAAGGALILHHVRRAGSGWTVAYGMIWFAVTLIPVLQVIPIPHVDSPISERYGYIPVMGAALAVGAGVELAHGRLRVLAMIAMALMCIALGGRTVAQIQVWESDINLWRHETRVHPMHFKAWTNLAMAHVRRGESGAAIEAVRRAVRIRDDQPMPHFILAELLLIQGDRQAAIGEYKRTLALEPAHQMAKERLTALSAAQDQSR